MSLFKKRAGHAVYYKEEKCKEKFLKYWGKFKKPLKKEVQKDTQKESAGKGKKRKKK
jgi:hypothetical protein